MLPIRFETYWLYQHPDRPKQRMKEQPSPAIALWTKRSGVRVDFLKDKLPDGGLIKSTYETRDQSIFNQLFALLGMLWISNPEDVVTNGWKTRAEMGMAEPVPMQAPPAAPMPIEPIVKPKAKRR